MPHQPHPHVHRHLEKRGVDTKELKALRRVGESMETANMDPPLRAAMVH